MGKGEHQGLYPSTSPALKEVLPLPHSSDKLKKEKNKEDAS